MRQFLLAVSCLAVAGLAHAQTYEIKIKQYPDKGHSIKHVETSKQVTNVKVTDEDGKEVRNNKEVAETKDVYVETTVTASDKGRASKFTRKYETATRSKDGDAKSAAHEGGTVAFELNKDGKYVAKGEGKLELSKEDAAKLVADLNREGRAADPFQELLPDKAVKVGDSWEISGKKLAGFIGEKDLDTKKSKGKGKLVKAYKKGDQQWGTIEISGDLEAKVEGHPTTATMNLTLDTPIDGAAATGKLEGKIVFTQKRQVEDNGKKYDVAIRSELNAKAERTEAK